MMKCLFIQSSAWLSIIQIFSSQVIRIILQVMLVIISTITVIYTLVTTTQEETRSGMVWSLGLTIVLPSLVEMMWLAKWFSHTRRVRLRRLEMCGQELVKRIVTSYTIMVMLLVELSSMVLLLTMSGDKEMFWAIFGLNSFSCILLSSNPVLEWVVGRSVKVANIFL